MINVAPDEDLVLVEEPLYRIARRITVVALLLLTLLLGPIFYVGLKVWAYEHCMDRTSWYCDHEPFFS